MRAKGLKMSDDKDLNGDLKELDAEYAHIFKQMARKALDGNIGTWLKKQTPYLALTPLSAYLMTRAVQDQREILDQSLKTSRSTARWTIGLAIMSVVIACVAAFASYHSVRSSAQWRAEQIPLLQKVADTMSATTQPGR